MTYRRLATASTLLPLAFALAALVGWITGHLRLASLHTEFIPMAPATAVAFVLVSAALIAVAFGHGTTMRNAVRVAACLVSILAFMELVEFFAGFTLIAWDAALIERPGTFGAVPLARMSPLTATTLALVGLALGCLTSVRSPAVRDLGGVFGSLALLIGSSVALGYAYGAPLLYGGQVIPMALTTGLGFMGTGVALVALAGPTSLPLRPFSRGAARAELAETRHRQLQDRSTYALSAAGAGIWEVDLASGTTHWSEVLGPMFGLPAEPLEITVDEFRARIHPDDRPMVDAAVTRSIESDAPYVVLFRARWPDGASRWISSKGRVSRNAAGEPLSMLGISIDVTERRELEQHLRQVTMRTEQAEIHRATLSALSAAVALALTDADSLAQALQQCAGALVTHLGAAFARIWTFNEREGVLELQASAGLYTHLNGPHGRVPLGQFKIGRIARDGKPHLTNAVIGDPHVNDQAWARREGMVAFAGYPLSVNGRVVGVMALFARHALSDTVISALASVVDRIALGIERHRNAEALRTAEERMRFALEAAGVGIWDMDYTTGVLKWSETLEAHYGLQPGTFGGTFEAFVERIHPDDKDSVLETVGKAMKSGADFSTLNRSTWPDGTVRWLSGAGRVHLGEHGEPVRGVGISLDVTERHTLEAQYQQAQKMEAIGRLAGGVAHDFNNLLTVILGYCELLLADLNPDDRRQADIAEIQKAGTSAAELTRQLLAFSRKQIIEPTLLDLGVVVADMRAMLGRLIGEDVKVLLGLRPELALVTADRGQVEQIVMNLAVNARDAMPTGGTLTIETANVELDERYAETHLGVQPGPYVALTVTDTGTGMTPQVQARLFEPFFTTKEPGKGTGLGMATVYGIATRSGGSVGLYSEVGKGTSVTVYFPRADAAESVVVAPPPVNRRRAKGQTVLLVEDADGLRELTMRLLQRQGYTVLVAANADEALRLFEEHPSIDLLLTDVVMPGTSGPELTKRLVRERRALRVIYMSGYTEEAIVQHGVLKPGIAFLHKPFTSDTLGRKIREVLER